MRLIVTDTTAAARTTAAGLPHNAVRQYTVHRLPVFESVTAGCVTRVFGTDGILFMPAGDPPVWEPRRRAAIRALGILSRDAASLVLACRDPLLAVQARDVVVGTAPALGRGARAGEPPFATLRHVDEAAAESRAADLEIDAVFADFLRDVDPNLRRQDLAALILAGGHPVPGDTLRRQGVSDASLRRLAERGYLVGEPAWWSPAAALLAATVPPAAMDPAAIGRCALWVDAVRRGTLTRAEAVRRARALLEGLDRPVAPDGFHGGRLVGRCPECGEWMGGVRERMRCMGCGLAYRIPRGVEVLAVPWETCASCSAPLVRPLIRGRADVPRCPDMNGCPSNIGSGVAPG